MPKHTLTLAAVVLVLAACSGSGPTDPIARDFAPSLGQTGPGTPGTPGTANCRGQTKAFLAQAGKNGLTPFNGIGGVARYVGLSVQEVNADVETFCNP